MRQTLVLVLLLAAVALSSSNVLPMSTNRLESTNNGQQNDNIFRSRYNNRNTFNTLFYTVPIGTSRSNRPLDKFTRYINTNNNREMESFNDVVSDDDNYDGEGFRKEQWHNYPRQLDRLHEYLLEYHKGDTKRNTDTDDPGTNEYDTAESKERIIGDVPTDDIHDSSEDIRNIYGNVIAATNPFLVLKIRLACLNTGLENSLSTQPELEKFQQELRNEIESNDDMEKVQINEINPLNKVKREGVSPRENSGEESSTGKKTVNKRLFSLWSRLQSLSHKGHELPHRRHLAYYGFPEGDSPNPEHSRRATLMRPPGSPLRWG